MVPQLMHRVPNASRASEFDRLLRTFAAPAGELQHRCQTCHEVKQSLSRCSGCKIVRYCCKEHQASNWLEHKTLCIRIKKCRTKLAKEDDAVRNAEEDFMTPPNAFETHAGHFWGIINTRDYMRARFALADTIRRIGTLDGVTESLEHLRDMLRLCRSDNMGLRDLVPYLMLQLDMDQECYDFIKWWKTYESSDDNYDFGNMDLPYLDTKDADMLEDVGYLEHKYGSATQVSAILLLKLKLLVDIINLQLTRKVIAPRLSPDLWRSLELSTVRSPISKNWAGKSTYPELSAKRLKLEQQIKRLGRYLNKSNPHVFELLLDAEEFLDERPEAMSAGSYEEGLHVLQYGYPAWSQHEGVFKLVRSAVAIARPQTVQELGGLSKTIPFSNEQKQEMLECAGQVRLWGYIKYAAADAVFLGEVKPSYSSREEIRALKLQDTEREEIHMAEMKRMLDETKDGRPSEYDYEDEYKSESDYDDEDDDEEE